MLILDKYCVRTVSVLFKRTVSVLCQCCVRTALGTDYLLPSSVKDKTIGPSSAFQWYLANSPPLSRLSFVNVNVNDLNDADVGYLVATALPGALDSIQCLVICPLVEWGDGPAPFHGCLRLWERCAPSLDCLVITCYCHPEYGKERAAFYARCTELLRRSTSLRELHLYDDDVPATTLLAIHVACPSLKMLISPGRFGELSLALTRTLTHRH